jgi:hypothetical protein
VKGRFQMERQGCDESMSCGERDGLDDKQARGGTKNTYKRPK